MSEIISDNKIVTDPVLLKYLDKSGIDSDCVEFAEDYSKEHPYAKVYRDINSNRKFQVISGLPMVKLEGLKIEPAWFYSEKNGSYYSRANLFSAIVDGLDVSIVSLDSKTPGQKLTYHPQLFLGGKEILPVSEQPEWLEIDPINENYHQNTLEWDFGICKRRLRIVESILSGYWVFEEKPTDDVIFKYNQTGDFKLKLGQYKVDDDTERLTIEDYEYERLHIPRKVTIFDSSSFYSSASAQDGFARRSANEAWATLKAGAGTFGNYTDSDVGPIVQITSMATTNVWWLIDRGIFMFDTSSLSGYSILSATIFLYG